MVSLQEYNDRENAKQALLASISTKLDGVVITEDLVHIAKAIEVLEDVNHFPEYEQVLAKLSNKVISSVGDISGEHFLLLSRVLQAHNFLKYGNEERYMLLNRDERNVDKNGHIIIGERTLESFGDRVLEEFYQEEEY